MTPIRPTSPARVACTTPIATAVTLALGLTAALVYANSPAAQANPKFPGNGDRVVVTLISDRQWNEAASWYDSSNKFRSQRDLPLATHDPKTSLWHSSMTYTSRVTHQNVDVAFTSAGRYAQCRVAVNGVVVRDRTARGEHAMALCRPR